MSSMEVWGSFTEREIPLLSAISSAQTETGTQAVGGAWIPLEGDHNFVEQNVIAGQMALGAGADCNFIGGNYIGTDVTGSVASSPAGMNVSGSRVCPNL